MATELLSGGIRFDGISSGTDFSSMIDQLKKVESIQKNRMELWKGDWEKRLAAFQEIRTEIGNLKVIVDKMDTTQEFMTKTASSSNSSILTAAAGTEALEGSYKLEVGQLATNAILTYQNGFTDKTASINSSGAAQEFVYTYKGEQHTISVADGTTLEGLVNMINKDSQNPGVRASLIKTGDQYMFQLKGMDLGANNTLTIDAATTVGSFDLDPAMWHEQAPQNAQYRINDWPGGSWLESSTNTLDEAIEGLTINLRDTGVSQVSVDTDLDKITENIRAFVDGMNTVRTKILELTKVDSNKSASDPNKETSQFDAEKGSVLTGNYGVQLLSSRLKLITSNSGPGFDYQYEEDGQTKGDIFSSLAQIGIMTNSDESSVNNGLLEIDEEKLRSALEKYPDEVSALFAASGEGISDSADFSYHSHVNGITKPGKYEVKYDIDASGNITNATIGGVPAKIEQGLHQIVAMDGPAKGLSVTVDNMTAGSYSDTVRLRQGKMGELSGTLAEMTSSNGTLKILERNYQDIIYQIDEKIEREESRLLKWEQNQRLRFSRLEATLTMYDRQTQALSSAIQQMSKS
ncbi:flagellar filament capping protein FliD [Oleidesulfovibrio sp.]|uniref:flagellar filament capping protein FliD n=1 Tax=Oleidesulfovibrio sp. TaxID=2909707 RepID=UPI003A858DD4